FAFVSALAERWPTESLTSNLREFHRTTPWLVKTVDSETRSVRLLHNLEASLWQQIAAMVPQPVDRIHVLSRFFDESPTLIDRVMRDFRPKRLLLYTQNGVTTMTTDWLS